MKASHFTILFSVLMIAFLLPHFIGEEKRLVALLNQLAPTPELDGSFGGRS